MITNSGSNAVTIGYQPTLSLQLTTPPASTTGYVACFYRRGSAGCNGRLQRAGHAELQPNPAHRSHCGKRPIPLAVLDSGGNQGLYVGTEWSYGDIQVAGSASNPQGATVRAATSSDFQTTLSAGQAFQVPPGFVGTYKGNIDAAGNSLRKYLYNYNTPAALRNNSTYPKPCNGTHGRQPGDASGQLEHRGDPSIIRWSIRSRRWASKRSWSTWDGGRAPSPMRTRWIGRRE